MKLFRNYLYSVISSIVATAISAAFVLGITGVLSGEPGMYTVLEAEELHRIPGNDFKYLDGNRYNLGYITYGSYLYSTFGTGIKNRGYVLIPDGLDSQYIEAEPEILKEIRSLGLLEDFPARPKMTFGVWLIGNTASIMLLTFLASITYLVIYVFVKERAVEKKKEVLLNDIGAGVTQDSNEIFRLKLLLAACYAAKSDGKIETDEIATIITILEQISKSSISASEVREILDLVPMQLSNEVASKIGKGLDEQQRWTIIRACILITASDGQIAGAELDFIFKLGVGFSFSEKQIFEQFKLLGLTKDA